ncbi:MAG: TetR/AcrR family transcriptional regulator [Deltaproteobacteria bacterium]|nr:TetR/AcrR family transcriptional regulator [Deltaproteobacteria bacterium]MBN2672030.1 TetR/AcrR family transcriptional regulator [Deltaproteobacteria bacterium]
MAIPNPCIQIPTTGRLRTEKRRTQIVEVAICLISHHGLREFKAARIAEALGVTTGALFRHFESMAEIADAVVAHIENLLFAESLPSVDHPLERLEAFFKQRVQVIHDHPAISRILLSDQVIDSAEFECFKQLREFRKRTGKFIKQCIEDALQQQLLNGIVSAEDAAVLVVGAVFALAHSPVQPGDAIALHKQGDRIWRVLYHNLTGEFLSSHGDG